MTDEQWQEMFVKMPLQRQHDVLVIENLQPTLAVTMNFNELLPYRKVVEIINIFEKRMNEKILGRKSENHVDRPVWANFYEVSKSNAHVHSAIVLDKKYEKAFRNKAGRVWAKLAKQGQLHIGEQYTNRWATYITKDGHLITDTA